MPATDVVARTVTAWRLPRGGNSRRGHSQYRPCGGFLRRAPRLSARADLPPPDHGLPRQRAVEGGKPVGEDRARAAEVVLL